MPIVLRGLRAISCTAGKRAELALALVEQVNKGGADKVMVEAADMDEAPEGPSDDQRLTALEAKASSLP